MPSTAGRNQAAARYRRFPRSRGFQPNPFSPAPDRSPAAMGANMDTDSTPVYAMAFPLRSRIAAVTCKTQARPKAQAK